jgi:hypothetical protein
MASYIDFSQPSLWVSAASIVFNPTFWNIAAQQEYHNKVITKLFGGNSRLGCYALAVTIFSLGIFRDYLYVQATTTISRRQRLSGLDSDNVSTVTMKLSPISPPIRLSSPLLSNTPRSLCS